MGRTDRADPAQAAYAKQPTGQRRVREESGSRAGKKPKKYDISCTQNRELSWLKFNERVLEEATDDTVPLLERLKFVEIFTSNLDEFFMVRVGSLFDMDRVRPKKRENKSLMTPKEQLAAIFDTVRTLYKKRDKIFARLERRLSAEGIARRSFDSLDKRAKKELESQFRSQILPVLSPLIIDLNNPFPSNLMSKGLWMAALLKYKPKYRKKYKRKYQQEFTLGLIPLPASLRRCWPIPGAQPGGRIEYVLLEDILGGFIGEIFPTVIDFTAFAITRNADISPGDEEVALGRKYREKILDKMKDALTSRWVLPPVRLEIQSTRDAPIAPRLAEHLELPKKQIYTTPMPLTLDYVYGLEGALSEEQRAKLCYAPWNPVTRQERFGEGSLMEAVRGRDVLLSYPYDDFGIFLELVHEAVHGPDVTSLQITVYRVGTGHVKLMNYMILAAEHGKEVTVLLELRARFDEQNNMEWVDSLREAGCHILYGFPDYKVHAKLCLIRSQRNGVTSYITYVGTGNFNAKTARLYSDLALLTADDAIGKDAELFFQNMENSVDPTSDLLGSYAYFLVAPMGFKQRMMELIHGEREKAEQGKGARILLKMNSLTDRELIDALVDAGQAGVRIDMIIRGICCLVPEIPGKTENIHVRSIVGRFLEHARVFVFGDGEDADIYISSADWMTRNTENRVEVACPIFDADIRRRIMDMLSVQLADNHKARCLGADGVFHKCHKAEELLDAQEHFMSEARRAATSVKPRSD